ncbi:hypothetical protein OQH60_03235 [Campylobacter sp. MIT 21-1685]|uniref:hypothetical protein n=1 Tax=unclassified Campylobacter TaxID=2593542 RepID=UPI00224B0F1C|nr:MULTISPECIES: hypothetical protein [unclassified Campylobacter]MCX2682880.1 hypothetical protein [Campylobacter sp. MIT 21-1684]MCX2751172.1 hypothetical protein [Campylobacter sp. MIT 21-1682]MCX2807361.1 hypothetical protein [Campylobacter sp. MIT 21-1685]
MTTLYGIMQYLGECKETQAVSPSFQNKLNNNNLNFSLDKYKNIKPLSVNNGIQVLRGFADSQTLASISQTNEEYQRKIESNHKREIEEYLIKNTQDKIYFPEVTLLYEYDATIAPEELPIKFLIDALDTKDVNILARIEAIGVASLSIDEEKEKLYRLDGNHRLEVLGKAASDGLKKNEIKRATSNNIFQTNRMLSFCVILVAKTQNFSYEHLYFYLLNSKSLPINAIKTLDIITKADNRELKEFVENDKFLSLLDSLKESWQDFDDKEKEVLISVVNEMISEKEEKDLSNILKEAIGIYKGEKNLENTQESMLGIICFLRLKAKDCDETKEKLRYFKRWVGKFHYDISHFKKISDLYESFIKYDEEIRKTRSIFVAMEFNEDYLKVYKSAINNVINRIKGENNLFNFELIPIMEQKSDVNIPDEIFKSIRDSHIVIVDISTNNTNVLLEYGYAKGLEKYIILSYCKKWQKEILKDFENIKGKKYLEKIKKDLEQKAFDVKVNNCPSWEEKNILEGILEKEIKEYLKNV